MSKSKTSDQNMASRGRSTENTDSHMSQRTLPQNGPNTKIPHTIEATELEKTTLSSKHAFSRVKMGA